MPNETQQPLSEQPPRSPADQELVSQVLGEEAAADMSELVGEQTSETTASTNTLGLTDDEQSMVNESQKSPEQRRKEYIEWAHNFNCNDVWIDAHLKFNSDGAVETITNLSLVNCDLTTLPSSLVRINGTLSLDENPINSLECLPKIITESLWLLGIPSTSIPDDLEIGGNIYLNENQVELAADATDKGYDVRFT